MILKGTGPVEVPEHPLEAYRERDKNDSCGEQGEWRMPPAQDANSRAYYERDQHVDCKWTLQND